MLVSSPLCPAQITTRVSVDSQGLQGSFPSANPGISANGRYVVFKSNNRFVPQDLTDIGGADVYRRDLWTGTTALVSWNITNSAAAGGGTDTGGAPSITPDGRFVVFESPTSNLVPNDTNGRWDVFVRDMQQGSTTRISVASDGTQGSGHSWTWHNAISDDGRYVVFFSTDPNLDPSFAPPPPLGLPTYTLYVRDLVTSVTRCVGSNAFMNRHQAVISGDGSTIAYQRYWDSPSQAGPREIWASSPSNPHLETQISQPNGFGASNPSVTTQGDRIAFSLAGGVFIRNMQTSALTMDLGGNSLHGILSADGTQLAFICSALPPGTFVSPPTCRNPANFDLFVKKVGVPALTPLNVGLAGCMTGGAQDLPALSTDGRMIVFGTAAGNLVADDTNGTLDVFLNDRSDIPPVADAGPDQSVAELALVTLDASASHDPDSPVLAYTWEQIAGTTVTLAISDPVRPTFVAPAVATVDGSVTLTFLLTVDDGEKSSTDVVNVVVVNNNHPPLAIAADALPVLEGSIVTLDGTESWDPDNDPLTYSWIGPGGITIADEDSATAWFVAPDVGQAGVDLDFVLMVSDGLESAFDLTTVRVENINHPPVAIAGADQTRDEGTTVFLDGSSSFDPDTADLLAPTWFQVAGPSVTLSDPFAWAPTFFVPLGSGGHDVVLELVVFDGLLYSTPSAVTIHLLVLNAPPNCTNAVASTAVLWPPDHKLAVVSILGVSDPDGDPVAIEITSVTQDEPVSGSGSGDTGPDAILVGGVLYLRAERSANGNGRVYEIHFTARDGNGAQCSGAVRVSVPKTKKQDQALDSGQNYSSIGN